MTKIYIYKIVNQLDNKVYIGQTVNPNRRWRDHQCLTRGKQEQYIHRAMNKYGIENFLFEIIAACKTTSDANIIEMEIIKQYNSRDKNYGYNVAPGGESPWNRGLAPEYQPMFGKHHSPESKLKSSISNTGKIKPHSKVWSDQMKGHKHGMTGKNHSEETKEKMSIAHSNISDETRSKMSKSKFGLSVSLETKLKMSRAKIGKKKSEQTKQKMSKSKRKFNDSIELEIYLLRKSGIVLREIANKYNCSIPTISRIFEKFQLIYINH